MAQEVHLEHWLQAGRTNASPAKGEDVVITGMAGCFPESDNIQEFKNNLANKADMVTADHRRWEAAHPELPKRAGKIWNVEKFDAGFFGVHQHQCEAVDPLCRIIMEKSFECILDAGINPVDLQGTKTGIYIGACASESEKYWFYDNLEKDAFAITGCHRSMLASRVAYALKLQGPAFVMDTACSSSFFAFEHAYRAIREGRCERAIVAGTNLCLHPYVTLQFSRLGVLSLDGACKCFDDAANGYTRSEAVCAILLQKSQEAKRIYAQVIHSKVNSDGYKEQGITYPSGDTQKNLIREVYEESQLHPNEISFMEAHGTGTKVGDPEELKAIDEIFLKDRDRPLLIGSVKSNIGHTEPTSGLCSIVKVVLSYENGKILPNMNFKTPRKGISALEDGLLKVITENTDWPDDRGLVGINSFGFGGANCHTILKWHEKTKKNQRGKETNENILVCVSGRTSEAVKTILEDLKQEKQHTDPEYVRLLHEIFRDNIQDFGYRGFFLKNKNQEIKEEINWCPEIKAKIIFNFDGFEPKNFEDLKEIEIFKQNISQDFDDNSEKHWQISFGNVFKTLGVVPDPDNQQDLNLKSKDLVLSFGSTQKGSEIIFSGSQISFYETLGKLYNSGITINLNLLYPQIDFPVSRGTPMISPLIQWDHTRDWYVTKYRTQDIIKTGFVYMAIDLKDEYWKYLAGHIADARNLFPATGYLVLVWEVLGMITGKITSNMKICFENVRFLKATNIPTKGTLFFTIMVQRGTGNFEVIEGGVSIVTGTIRELPENDILPKIYEPADNDIVLTQKDIYTELKLRGYNYRGAFKVLDNVTLPCEKGLIEWSGNWVTFLDGMLQMSILQEDTRNLYVPTAIKWLYIDAMKHSKQAENLRSFPVWAYKDRRIVRSGQVECRGILANVINRKKLPEPVVEKYCFVPNEIDLDLGISLRIVMQIALENFPLTRVKIIENLEDDNQSIAVFIRNALDDFPLIEADLRIFTSKDIDPGSKRIVVEDKTLGTELDCYLQILDQTKLGANVLKKVSKVLKPQGFLLVKFNENNQISQEIPGFNLLVKHNHKTSGIILYQRQKPEFKPIFIEYLQEKETELFKKVQNTDNSSNIILFSSHKINGLLGFTNCLRKEPSFGTNVKCFVLDQPFNGNDKFYQNQLNKQLAINVLQNDTWGTYRHLPLEINTPEQLIEVDHAYVNVTTRGDLSSLSWIQGPIENDQENVIKVYYGAINFRDVMTASGRVSVDAITNDRLEQECVQGFEYAGIDSRGRRVMGMLTSGALSTVVVPDPDMVLPVPDHWSLEDAVTVPVVYGTVLYGFFMRAGGLSPGQSVLIHSGTGGVGQAAIAIALFFKCQVFVTVGSTEKKNYLLKKYPFLKKDNIGYSRDTTFEALILKRTKGKGVDIILNSLSEEKLQSSLRCVANNGHFLEIGKFDLAMDNPIDLGLMQKGITVHGIMLDGLFKTLPRTKHFLMNCLRKAIHKGAVRPLDRTTFARDELEKAFRYMSTGKHVGKVVIKIRDDPRLKQMPPKLENNEKFLAIPRYFCKKSKSCLVIGGLGGFGLELCDWLVLRGCKQLFITSRKGPTTGYQHLRLKTWRSYGASVTILIENLHSEQSCTKTLAKIPELDAIFNLAVVLHDGLFETQTESALKEVLLSKYTTTKHLDNLSRTLCPDLRHFVVFSSVSCGRGNIAQANYGLANSLMEKLIESRKRDGFPALAIQWGSIADVGLAAELINDDLNERPIGGTLPQKISNCLEFLDRFMAQSAPVVASMVVAEKRGGLLLADNMVDTVVNIMGLRDLKTVSLHSSLPELGMDSMMAVEIKQTLEREYEVFLTPHDIRTLTFARLQDLQSEKEPKTQEKSSKETKLENVNHLLRFINDEECSKKATIFLKSALNGVYTATTPKIFMIPGVEGFASILEPLCLKLHAEIIGLQFVYDNPPDTLQEMAQLLVPYIIPYLNEGEPFNLVAYSFGCCVAVELAAILEEAFGFQGMLILIDGAHEMMFKITEQQTNIHSPAELETSILCNIFTIYMPLDLVDLYREELLQMESYEDRVNFVQEKSPEAGYSKEYIKKVCIAFYKRVRAVVNYKRGEYLLKSKVILLKPIRQSVIDIDEDYNLSKFTRNQVEVKSFDADHYSILENDQVAKEIDVLIHQKWRKTEERTIFEIDTNLNKARTR